MDVIVVDILIVIVIVIVVIVVVIIVVIDAVFTIMSGDEVNSLEMAGNGVLINVIDSNYVNNTRIRYHHI